MLQILTTLIWVIAPVLMYRETRAIQREDAEVRAEIYTGVHYVWRRPPGEDGWKRGHLERIPAGVPVVPATDLVVTR